MLIKYINFNVPCIKTKSIEFYYNLFGLAPKSIKNLVFVFCNL